MCLLKGYGATLKQAFTCKVHSYNELQCTGIEIKLLTETNDITKFQGCIQFSRVLQWLSGKGQHRDGLNLQEGFAAGTLTYWYPVATLWPLDLVTVQ